MNSESVEYDPLSPFADVQNWALVEDGNYVVNIIDAQSTHFGKSPKITMVAEIVEGKHRGKHLLFAFNNYPKHSGCTKYYRAWTTANGGKKPRAATRMSTKIFFGKRLLVKVSTSKKKFDDGEVMPRCNQISRVDGIIKIVSDDHSDQDLGGVFSRWEDE